MLDGVGREGARRCSLVEVCASSLLGHKYDNTVVNAIVNAVVNTMVNAVLNTILYAIVNTVPGSDCNG